MRSIILHHHLFKNAGTSLDQILKWNFGSGWVTQEFPGGPSGTGERVAEWIASQPEAVVFSSHTMRGPLPPVPGLHVIPVIFLRDPIARIRSAYSFERMQAAETVGTQLARENDFEGYVQSRLALKGDRQCRDFHVSILAGMSPGTASDLERAKETVTRMREAGVVGLVEDFNAALVRLAARIRQSIRPEFHWQETRANTSDKREAVVVTEAVDRLLREVNAGDLALLEWARATD